MNLLDLIHGDTGNQVAEQAENKFGISKNQVIALLAVATPLVISYLRKKSEDPTEADKLNAALERDHDGSILNDPSQALNRQEEGSSILSHIFGANKETVESQLSENTGISMSKIGPILAMLAPMIMGFIGKQKQTNNVTSGGGLADLLSGILGNASQQAQQSNNPLSGLLNSFLGNGTQSNQGGLSGLLGNLFGK
ncbi:MAG: DUF937 domain-containing protein [Niabella sp.]